MTRAELTAKVREAMEADISAHHQGQEVGESLACVLSVGLVAYMEATSAAG